MKLTATFKPQKMDVKVTAPSMGISTGTLIARDYVERDPYEGPYEITPAAEAQTLLTDNLRMTDNIVVAAIPDNYGLITWNGSTLTVS